MKGKLLTIAVMAVLMTGYARGIPTWWKALIFAPMLFVVATAAHRKLYNARPDSGHLTLFYISMSVGGALGGLFNSIIAPNISKASRLYSCFGFFCA